MMWPGLGSEIVIVGGMSLEFGQVRRWLEVYLREGFEIAAERQQVRGCWKGNCWSGTMRLRVDVVRDLVERLRVEGGLGARYRVLGDEELGRQAVWMREGGWRVGSEAAVVEQLSVHVQGKVQVEEQEARDKRQESMPKNDSTTPEIASSVKNNDDEYDGVRIKFFEEMVTSIVDDCSIPGPLPRVESPETQDRRIKCSTGALSCSGAPDYREDRPVQPVSSQFQTAYEQHLQEEHLCLLEKRRTVAAHLDDLVAQSRELDKPNQTARCKDVTKESFPVYAEPSISTEPLQPESGKFAPDAEKSLKREVWLSRLRSAATVSDLPFDERRVKRPVPIVTGWEDYSDDSDNETIISSNLLATAEEAFREYQRSETTTQGWMEWLIPNR